MGWAHNVYSGNDGQFVLLLPPLSARLFNLFFKKILFIYLFLERGEGRERGKDQCVIAFRAPPTGDMAHNPGTCPGWESYWQPFGSWACTELD